MKHVLVGIDGTGDRRADRTNVLKFIEAVEYGKRTQGAAARCHYFRGVGSHRRNRLRGGVTGRKFTRVVRRAYQWVSATWKAEDKLSLVGFSRGGAAALSLANMIWACGVSQRTADSRVAKEALRVYGAREGFAGGRRAAFQAKYGCRREMIDFVGLFDPVAALGMPMPHQAARLVYGEHDFTLRGNVRQYVSLLALDEHRWHFRPIVLTGRHMGQQVQQVWVPGSHGDVGGGGGQVLADAHLELMVALAWPEVPVRDARRVAVPLGSELTNSFRPPYSWFPRVERAVGLPATSGESVSQLAQQWLRGRRNPSTSSWDGARRLVQ